MNEVQVYKRLCSIGMAWFVKYFAELSNESLSRLDLLEMVMQNEGYKEKATISRITSGRSIIRRGGAKTALNLIAEASKVPDHIREEAKRLCDSIRTDRATRANLPKKLQ